MKALIQNIKSDIEDYFEKKVLNEYWDSGEKEKVDNIECNGFVIMDNVYKESIILYIKDGLDNIMFEADDILEMVADDRFKTGETTVATFVNVNAEVIYQLCFGE